MRLAVLTLSLFRSSTSPLIFDDGVGGAGVGGSVGLAELSTVAYTIVLAIPDERHTICKWANGDLVMVAVSGREMSLFQEPYKHALDDI